MRAGIALVACLKRVVYLTFALAFPIPALAAEPLEPANLLRKTGWCRFEIYGGRITAPELARAPNRSLNLDFSQTKESLSLNTSSSESALVYLFTSDLGEYQVDCKLGGRFHLRDGLTKSQVSVEQSPGEPIRVTVETGDGQSLKWEEPTIWHHLLLHEGDSARHLIPRLETLHPNWKLAEQTEEVRTALWQQASTDWPRERRRWKQLVADLSASDFQVRRAADAALRADCVAAHGFLQSLDLDHLEPESRRRVERLILQGQSRVDEPPHVATTLLYDARLWTHFMRDLDPEKRQLAADHLAKLLGRGIRFDATANLASREKQLAVIEETLLSR